MRFVRQPPHEELLALAASAEVVLSPFPVGIGHLALDLYVRHGGFAQLPPPCVTAPNLNPRCGLYVYTG